MKMIPDDIAKQILEHIAKKSNFKNADVSLSVSGFWQLIFDTDYYFRFCNAYFVLNNNSSPRSFCLVELPQHLDDGTSMHAKMLQYVLDAILPKYDIFAKDKIVLRKGTTLEQLMIEMDLDA